MPLCQRCEEKKDKHGKSVPLQDLKKTSCEFCSIICEAVIQVLKPSPPHDYLSVSFPAFSSLKKEPFHVNVFFLHTFLSIWCSWGTHCPWGILSTQRNITPIDHIEQGSFDTARGWIQECVDNHDCGGVEIPQLPTRVIDTMLDADGSSVRLVDGAPAASRYACLSHCWGSKPQFITTDKTLARHKESIPWEALPKTFQDAITITRRLQIRYIWIDSLCIVQDSPTDWATESSRMAEIYRNSYVTIAATSSHDGAGGLHLQSKRQDGTRLTGTTSLGKPYDIRVQYSVAPHMTIDDDMPKSIIQHPMSKATSVGDSTNSLAGFPLLTRGWVFQERLLSPRFLQFGSHELLWDCSRSAHCECGQRPADLAYNQVHPQRLLGDNKDGDNDNDDGHRFKEVAGQEILPHSWRKIVEFYSTLDLTYQTDRLPALSGLAKQIGRMRPEAEYLAGIWSDSLDLDLLWMPYGPSKDHPVVVVDRGKQYIAPSWSWCSSSKTIAYPSVWRLHEARPSVRVIQKYFEAVKYSCTTHLSGRVSEGYLVLSANLAPVTATQDDDGLLIHCGGTAQFKAAGPNEAQDTRSNWRLPFERTSRRVFFDEWPVTLDDLQGDQGKKDLVACRLVRVQILENSNFMLLPDARETIEVEFCLLLAREREDLYRRIGLLLDGRIIQGHRGDEMSWEKDKSCFEELSSQERTQVIII